MTNESITPKEQQDPKYSFYDNVTKNIVGPAEMKERFAKLNLDQAGTGINKNALEGIKAASTNYETGKAEDSGQKEVALGASNGPDDKLVFGGTVGSYKDGTLQVDSKIVGAIAHADATRYELGKQEGVNIGKYEFKKTPLEPKEAPTNFGLGEVVTVETVPEGAPVAPDAPTTITSAE